jgi:cell fate (sporulation/competence/biofilm development) regulator YlbF (YheA/YmcA/DUF963 family)
MDDVLTKADELARAIRASDRYRTLRKVETELDGDEETEALTREFEEARNAIAEKERAGRPVEVEDKRRLAAVQERVGASANLQRLLRAQADFYEMMNRVNGTIQSVLGDDPET